MSHNNTSFTQSFDPIIKADPSSLQVNLHKCFHVTVAPEWKILNRSLDCYFMVYIIDGRGTYMVDDKVIKTKPGRVIFLNRNQIHSILPDSKNPPAFISLHFDILLNGMPIDQIGTDFMVFDYVFQNDIRQIFNDISQNYQHSNKAYKTHVINHLMATLLLKCYDTAANDSYVSTDPRIIKGKEMIDQGITSDLSIELVADKLQMTRKHFSRRFKEIYHISPKAYIIKKRITLAKYLIAETDTPLQKISEQLNYTDYYAFSNQFKKHTGLSPSTFKQASKKSIDRLIGSSSLV